MKKNIIGIFLVILLALSFAPLKIEARSTLDTNLLHNNEDDEHETLEETEDDENEDDVEEVEEEPEPVQNPEQEPDPQPEPEVEPEVEKKPESKPESKPNNPSPRPSEKPVYNQDTAFDGEEDNLMERDENAPLLAGFEIISNSRQSNGESLAFVETEFDLFEYDYTLPKRVEAFTIQIEELEGVTLIYQEEHEFSDEETSITVPVEAYFADIIQGFYLTVYRKDSKLISLEVNDLDLEVYESDSLDTVMQSFGFVKESFEKEEATIPYFRKNKLSLILFVDEENNALWYSLDENSKLGELGILYIDEKNNPLLILETNNYFISETIASQKHTLKNLEIDKDLLNIDPDLEFETEYGSWELDQSKEVAYGIDSTGNKDFYSFDGNTIELWNIEFDEVEKEAIDPIIMWGGGGLMFSFIATGALYTLAKKTSKS